jgi:hypothetical protein
MMHSSINKTGLGQMPAALGQIGWFGSPHIKTMLVDCGCGSGEECKYQSVLYIHQEADSYSFYFDVNGDLIACTPQTHAMEARQVDMDLLPYLDKIQAEYWEIVEPFENQVGPIEDEHRSADNARKKRRLLGKLSSMPPEMASYIITRVNASRKATMGHYRRRILAEAASYLERLQAGQNFADLQVEMTIEGIDPELIDQLRQYADDVNAMMLEGHLSPHGNDFIQ